MQGPGLRSIHMGDRLFEYNGSFQKFRRIAMQLPFGVIDADGHIVEDQARIRE